MTPTRLSIPFPLGHAGGLLWVAAGASLWGTDTVLRQPLTSHLTSGQIVLNEHLILAAVLLPTLWASRAEWRALKPVQWAAVLGISWGGSALATVCFTEAVAIGNPTTAVLLQKTQPFFAALLARSLLGEALGSRFWMFLLLAVCGACLVSFGSRLPAGAVARAPAIAALAAVSAAALWASSTVLSRLALESLSFHTLTALRIVVATPFLAALVWFHAHALIAPLGARQALSLVLLALVPGLLALLIYYRGLSHTRASLAAVAELSFPAVATLLNWLFLGATIAVAQLAGFVLLCAVILKLQRREHA